MDDSKDKIENVNQKQGLDKVWLFVIGILVGAVVSTGAFFAYIKIAGVGSEQSMQMSNGPGGHGGTPPERPSGEGGTPPEKPSGESGEGGTPPERPSGVDNAGQGSEVQKNGESN